MTDEAPLEALTIPEDVQAQILTLSAEIDAEQVVHDDLNTRRLASAKVIGAKHKETGALLREVREAPLLNQNGTPAEGELPLGGDTPTCLSWVQAQGSEDTWSAPSILHEDDGSAPRMYIVNPGEGAFTIGDSDPKLLGDVDACWAFDTPDLAKTACEEIEYGIIVDPNLED